MARLRIDVPQLPSVQRAMQAFGPGLDAQLGDALRTGMAAPKARAVYLAPKKTRTLAGSIYIRTTKTARGWRSVLGASAKHAGIREFGGTIRARRKPWLVFMGQSGHLVRVKQVTQKATPYMRPAVRQTRAGLVTDLQTGARKALKPIVQAGG